MFAGPEHNLSQVNIEPGMHVVDIGAGVGHYALTLGRMLQGTNGRVFAVDVRKDLLEKLDYEAQQQGLSNIEVVWGDSEELKGTRLRDKTIDLVVIANTLFQLEQRQNVLTEAHRILKPGGHLLFVDWSDSFGGMGPRQNQVIQPAQIEDMARSVGLDREKEIDTGEHHYGIIFRKK